LLERQLKNTLKVLSGVYSETESKDFSEPIDEDKQAKNYGHYSDSDLEDDDDDIHATVKAPKKAATPKRNSLELYPFLPDDEKPTYREWNESSGKGAIIKVCDIAFIT
jgi:hypothetical protein